METTRPPMSERQAERIGEQYHKPEPPEGVALDVAMDELRESETNRNWANRQAEKLSRDFRRMRLG